MATHLTTTAPTTSWARLGLVLLDLQATIHRPQPTVLRALLLAMVLPVVRLAARHWHRATLDCKLHNKRSRSQVLLLTPTLTTTTTSITLHSTETEPLALPPAATEFSNSSSNLNWPSNNSNRPAMKMPVFLAKARVPLLRMCLLKVNTTVSITLNQTSLGRESAIHTMGTLTSHTHNLLVLASRLSNLSKLNNCNLKVSKALLRAHQCLAVFHSTLSKFLNMVDISNTHNTEATRTTTSTVVGTKSAVSPALGNTISKGHAPGLCLYEYKMTCDLEFYCSLVAATCAASWVNCSC